MKRIFFSASTLLCSFVIHAQNRVGVGTNSPQGKLHVNNSTLTNAQYIGGAVSIFENGFTGVNSFLQLMNTSNRTFSIGSGTDISFYRSGISFQADSSITLETGGFTPRMKIDNTGVVTVPNRIGIGNTEPATKLHVSNFGNVTNAQYIGSALAVFENNSEFLSGFLQLMNPSARPFSIGSGTELSFYRSGITFQQDSSVTIEAGGFSPRMKIDKVGVVSIPNRLGIGTSEPAARLHVNNTGFSLPNAQYISSATTVFENNNEFSNSFLQLMNPSARTFSIGSGTELSFYRSGISFQPDSSVTIETGGFSQRMKIDKVGVISIPNKLGVGTTAPVVKLHVSNSTLANAQYISSASTIIENGAGVNSFFQLVNPSSRSFSIGSGTELSFYRSGISFQADSSLTFETGGNNSRVAIKNDGDVGIGTINPLARLHVNGSAIIGNNGTVLTEVIKGSFSKDVASVPANSSVTETFTVPNSQLASTVYVSPSTALANGLIIGYARVFPAGTVEVRFTNVTGSAINPATMDFYITVIR